jgi:hypothetical protein
MMDHFILVWKVTGISAVKVLVVRALRAALILVLFDASVLHSVAWGPAIHFSDGSVASLPTRSDEFMCSREDHTCAEVLSEIHAYTAAQ